MAESNCKALKKTLYTFALPKSKAKLLRNILANAFSQIHTGKKAG